MDNFDKYINMLGEINGYTILKALIYTIQHGDKISSDKDDIAYQTSFTFVDYTPCIDIVTVQYNIRSSSVVTFNVQYSNDVLEAVNVGDKPLVNESLCMVLDDVDDEIDHIVDFNVNIVLHTWLDKVAKRIRTEFIAAHAFIDANEEAQEAEKKIADEQETMKTANAEEEENILKDSVLKFIDHIYEYESGKDVFAKVKSEIKNISSEAFGTIVDGLSNAAKELSARLDELQNKMDSESNEVDESKTPDPDVTVNGYDAKDEDDEDWNNDYSYYSHLANITAKITIQISPELLISMHHKMMHSKETSVASDIASIFFYNCCEKAAIRLRENKLRIDAKHLGTPLGGSYKLEVYDRTTNTTVWCKTFDFHNVTPEMIVPYLDNSTRKTKDRKHTTIADFSAIEIRAMIFTALNRIIIQNILNNDIEIPLAISYIEGKDPDEIYSMLKDQFNYFFPEFNSTAHDLFTTHTNVIPELEKCIKKHVDEEDDDE